MSKNPKEIDNYREPSGIGEFFKEMNQPTQKSLWARVKELEESYASTADLEKQDNELKEFRATCIVNFGDTGRTQPGLVKESQSATQMFISIFEHYVKPKV
jgi:hypothetical protein